MKTIDYRETVRGDLRRDPAYARSYFREAVGALKDGEADVAAAMFDDIEAAGVLSFRRRAPLDEPAMA